MEFFQDISLLKSLIDWNPSYSLKEGILKTYSLMSEYYKDKKVKTYIQNYYDKIS